MSANSSSRDLRVSTYASGQQQQPDIAAGPLNNFVITWQSQRQDGDGFGVFGRAYGGSTAPLASEFQVNSTTQGNQRDAAVAMADSGNFVVTWASDQATGRGLYAQLFQSTGTRIGSEFRVGSTGLGTQQANPDVATDALGNFVVVYESRGLNSNSLGQDTSGTGVFAQRFDRTGAVVGPEFRVNTITQGNQTTPAVAMNGLGEYLVTWAGPSRGGTGIFAQRYSNTGLPLGIEFQVNSIAQGSQSAPTVAFDNNGNFVVAWQGQGGSGNGSDTDGYGIYAQRYSSNGSPVGNQILVNTTTRGDQITPSVATDNSGAFTVVWSGGNRRSSVYGQRFLENGSRDGSEFQVNESSTSDQLNPTVALSPTSDFIVAWQDQDRRGNSSILARTSVFKNRIRGTQRDDNLKGTSRGDEILGLGSNDRLQGLGGNDLLRGGAGNDRLEGGNDNDVLQGGANEDSLDGGDGNDTLTGGGGIDTFVLKAKRGSTLITDFQAGTDLLGLSAGINAEDVRIEQQGSSTILTWRGVRLATLLGVQAQDVTPGDFTTASTAGRRIVGTEGADDLVGTSGSDEILGLGGRDTLSGRAGDDSLDGGSGGDQLFGEDGADSLIGGVGSDSLVGGRGDDFLEADDGNDILIGGAGADTFFLQFKTGLTTIQDFQDGVDLLSLDTGISARTLVFQAQGADTLILSGGQTLALLKNTSPAQFSTGPSDFA